MIELAMSVCLLSDPTRCKSVSLNFDDQLVTAEQCTSAGQFAMAQWNVDHPAWEIKRWTCRPAGQFANL